MFLLHDPIGSPGSWLVIEKCKKQRVVKLTAFDVGLIGDWVSQCFELVTSFLWKAFFILLNLSVFFGTAVTLFLFLANTKNA